MSKAIHMCGESEVHLGECSDCSQLEQRVEVVEDKLDTIQEGAEVNVQSDWNETDPTSDSYIRNKPSITVEVDSELSPTSTNPVENRVITQALANIDVGYSCEETSETLTSETVNASESMEDAYLGAFQYSEPITADNLTVTFQGTDYVCSKNSVQGVPTYGAAIDPQAGVDFSTYPFCVVSIRAVDPNGDNLFYVGNQGQYAVTLAVEDTVIETSECFDRARGYSCHNTYTLLFDETVGGK